MKITVTFEVESRSALVTILKTGSDHSLFDYQVLDFEIHKENDNSIKDVVVLSENLMDRAIFDTMEHGSGSYKFQSTYEEIKNRFISLFEMDVNTRKKNV